MITDYLRQAQRGTGMIVVGAHSVGTELLQKGNGLLNAQQDFQQNSLFMLQEMIDKLGKFGTKVFAGIQRGHNIALPGFRLEARAESKSIVQEHYAESPLDQLRSKKDEDIIEHFRSAAKVAQIVGYHGIQINLAANKNEQQKFVNDYALIHDSVDDLLNQFRLARRVIKAIRKSCGFNFPVALNLNLSPYLVNYFESQFTEELFFEPELTYEQFLEDMRTLSNAGFDAFIVSSKAAQSQNWYTDELYRKPFFNLCGSIKKWVKKPVIITAYKSSGKVAVEMLESKGADAMELSDSAQLGLSCYAPASLNNNVDFVPSYYWLS
jgi:2-enoate reductase